MKKLDYTPILPAERDIQKSIFDYLLTKQYFCWRNNTGGRPWVDNLGKGRVFKFGLKGSGDILGLTKQGIFFSIEVKRPGKKPTPEQVDFIRRINDNCGLAFVAYDLADVISHGL